MSVAHALLLAGECVGVYITSRLLPGMQRGADAAAMHCTAAAGDTLAYNKQLLPRVYAAWPPQAVAAGMGNRWQHILERLCYACLQLKQRAAMPSLQTSLDTVLFTRTRVPFMLTNQQRTHRAAHASKLQHLSSFLYSLCLQLVV
jgi:hypothetical protein